ESVEQKLSIEPKRESSGLRVMVDSRSRCAKRLTPGPNLPHYAGIGWGLQVGGMTITATYTCIVVGTGPAGLATALSLAKAGAEVTLAGPPAPVAAAADTRTAALFNGSITLLLNLGVWS